MPFTRKAGAFGEEHPLNRGSIRRWFICGVGVKRWITLCVVSVAVMTVTAMNFGGGKYSYALLTISLALLCLSILKIVAFIDIIATIAQQGHLDDYFVDIKRHPYVPRIVMIGGGTGLSTLLRGIREYGKIDSSKNLAAIVTVADNGGSSGKLREEMNILPPGDIRNCLIALSTEEPTLARLFQYRFADVTGLSGHSFGNLFIAAMTEITGDFVKAVKESSKILAVSGKVLPSTTTPLDLRAIYDDGSAVRGESQISYRHDKKIKNIEIIPSDAQALPEAISEIENADVIVLGPGSLYTSLIPNLLIKGIREAIIASHAVKIYICNVMTQYGETDGYRASDHLRAICDALGANCIDCMIVSDTKNADESLLARYRAQNAYTVEADVENITGMHVKTVMADLSSYNDFLRHDPQKLANCLMGIIKRKNETRND